MNITTKTVVETTTVRSLSEDQAKKLIIKALDLDVRQSPATVEFIIRHDFIDKVVVIQKHRTENEEVIPNGQDQDR